MLLDIDLAAFKNMLALDITLSSTLANIDGGVADQCLS